MFDRTPVHVTSLVTVVSLLERFEVDQDVCVFVLAENGAEDLEEITPIEASIAQDAMMDRGLALRREKCGRFGDMTPTQIFCHWEADRDHLHQGDVGLISFFDKWAFDGGYYIERPLLRRAYAVLANARRAPL